MTTEPLYHNPQNVPACEIPPGWWFRKSEDAGKRAKGPCRMWIPSDNAFSSTGCIGTDPRATYIVPITYMPDEDEPKPLYHNPERVSLCDVPEGWRFRRCDEMDTAPSGKCRGWNPHLQEFYSATDFGGVNTRRTFIVPCDTAEAKPLDPKGEAGAKKPQLQLIPPVLGVETAKALVNGAKYGPWNWRHTPVEMMTYLGAMKRHIDALIDGEDIDPESGAHHLGHVAAGCGIVLDARKHGTLVDNRPPMKPSEPSR